MVIFAEANEAPLDHGDATPRTAMMADDEVMHTCVGPVGTDVGPASWPSKSLLPSSSA